MEIYILMNLHFQWIFIVNKSPFAGKTVKYLTIRHIKEKLFRELEVNVGLLWKKPTQRMCSR
jgi:predicted membrane GTPase involved in stress response